MNYICEVARNLLRTMPLNQKIRSLLPLIKEYLKGQPVLRAWLFGSYSRGEENPQSDIDILVDYDHKNHSISLFTIIEISLGLEKITGKKVDLIENGCLMDFAVESANLDKILIYERNIKGY